MAGVSIGLIVIHFRLKECILIKITACLITGRSKCCIQLRVNGFRFGTELRITACTEGLDSVAEPLVQHYLITFVQDVRTHGSQPFPGGN